MSGFWPVVEAVIRKSDVVVLVFDARLPEMSKNDLLERKVNRLGRPLVLVANKIDLIEEKELNELKKQHKDWIFVSGTKNIGMNILRRKLQILNKDIKKDYPSTGIVGYPNVGKSAIINALARRAKTLVSPTAGTTRGHQIVRSGSLNIVDSPGVIPYEDKGVLLGMIGAKSPEQLRYPDKVAIKVINMFLEKFPDKLKERFNLDNLDELNNDPYEILLAIGKKRGFVKKGGDVDETKTALQIIREWQTGKLRS